MTDRSRRTFVQAAAARLAAWPHVGRAIEKGETRGFMKVIVDAETQGILGAAILGTKGDEAIHGILDTMYAKANYRTLQNAVHIHPTVSELIPTLLGQLKPVDPKSA
jgi:pyruvate/2-oxoglutarate dehydrogenase complex dihydrolipoamide dehydrogenase (E3) component